MAGLTKAAREAKALAEVEDSPVTIAMFRDEPVHAGGPTTADVHPDEVENMRAYGWKVGEA